MSSVFRSLRTGVTGGCKLPEFGLGNQTWTFCKSNKCSLTAEPSFQPLNGAFINLSTTYFARFQNIYCIVKIDKRINKREEGNSSYLVSWDRDQKLKAAQDTL